MIAEEKERIKKSRKAEWVGRCMAGFKARFTILSAILKMNSRYIQFEEKDRLYLIDAFDRFKELYFSLILYIAKLKDAEAYICPSCWNILILRKSQKKAKYVTVYQMKAIDPVLSRHDEPDSRAQCKKIYSDIGISELKLEQKPLLKLVPGIYLPGDRKREARGHDCQGLLSKKKPSREQGSIPREVEEEDHMSNRVDDREVIIGNPLGLEPESDEEEEDHQAILERTFGEATDNAVLGKRALENYETITVNYKNGKKKVLNLKDIESVQFNIRKTT